VIVITSRAKHVVTTAGWTAPYPFLRKRQPAPPSSKPTKRRAEASSACARQTPPIRGGRGSAPTWA
jgi:hypothetical protein